MVPVALRLKNFMSYGEAAPVLDFQQFQVACLSGNNGQGKSALLDAITWALWGEARKTSDSRKPDEHLLRVGAHQMEVEFTFDLEGQRYRVLRRYTRSSSGKTSRSELELQVYEPETGAYRPLTGSSVSETQRRLNQLLGIDYQTFINASFLLQGRANEFTRKKPSERKEILARILNLDRYERLAELARDEVRQAKARAEQLERQISQIQEALQEEPALKTQHSTLLAQQRALEAERDRRRQERDRLQERRVRLEEAQRRLEELREEERLQAARLQEERERLAGLEAQLQDLEQLLERREEIERAYERSQALQEERRLLETRRDQHWGVQKQLDQVKAERDRLRAELEKKLELTRKEREHVQRRLQELAARLRERPTLEARLQAALQARQEMNQLEEKRQQRRALEEEIRKVSEALLSEQKQLEGQLNSLRRQQEQEAEVFEKLAELEASCRVLEQEVVRYRQLREELEQLKEDGTRKRQEIEGLQVRLQEIERQQQELQQRYTTFLQAEADVCPVCGSTLDPEHRQEVERHYQEQLQALERLLAEGRRQLIEQQQQLEQLRKQYRKRQHEVERRSQAPEQLAARKAQLEELRQRKTKLEELKRQTAALKARLEARDFGQLHRQRLEVLHRQLEAIPFDEARLETLRQRAAEAISLRERLEELEMLQGQRESLENEQQRLERLEQHYRHELDRGDTMRSLQQRIQELQEKLQQIGFDPARLQQVQQELEALGDVSVQLHRLLHAQEHLAKGRQEREALQRRLAQETEALARLRQQLERLEQELKAWPEVQAACEAAQQQLEDSEQALREVQQQLGECRARLEQLQTLRARCKQLQQELEQVQHHERLHQHLQRAFGKHGIPSLIIEQTLPELEARANELLERLTDGRMHVYLRTQRTKKSGGTKETLDIIITDEQGAARPYETFSGGEAFRVDFALRLALAQLLAERSGVRVRTLVIDEGFGTQDPQGLQLLIEAIQAVQSDFDKILVITHLSELKQVFPVRIEVEKDPVEGSRFELVGV